VCHKRVEGDSISQMSCLGIVKPYIWFCHVVFCVLEISKAAGNLQGKELVIDLRG